MKCPYCSYLDSKVVDSRNGKDGTSIRRRRECLKCNRRFTTYERIEEINLVIVKKDGRRESFDRSKIKTVFPNNKYINRGVYNFMCTSLNFNTIFRPKTQFVNPCWIQTPNVPMSQLQ